MCHSLFRSTPVLPMLLLAFGLSAQPLPELGNALQLDGTPSSARFFAGATVAGEAGFLDRVLTQDEIRLRAEVRVEAAHVGSRGNLYLVVALGERFFMRDATGAYLEWDGQLTTLVPAVPDKALLTAEPLSILEDVEVGQLWLAGHTLHFFFAYDLLTAPGQLVFSGTPFTLTIERYEPLQNTRPGGQVFETAFIDDSRQREIPLLIYLPQTVRPRPVILFSHGLGGSRYAAEYLGRHWSARGYVAVFMQHPGSDASVLEGVPALLARVVLEQAASAGNLIARVLDVGAVIDQLELWNEDPSSALHQRVDLTRVGMSGHSFGARTTQAVSGESIPWIGAAARDPRIDAALPLSPSAPGGSDAGAAFAGVDMPWMLMTGTLDEAVIGDTSVADRLAVYPALPPGGKYELVLFEGEHHAFSDGQELANQSPRNPAHHPQIMALSAAFWDAWLLGYGDALRWLEGEGARSVLQPGDSWQFK